MVRSIRLTCFVALVIGLFASPVFSEGCLELVGRWAYGPASAVAVAENYAYIASGPSLIVADIADPTSPQVVGEVELGVRVVDMTVADSYAYLLADQRLLTVVDVSVPEAPVRVGSHEIRQDASHLEVADGYAYVTMGDAGLSIIDVTSPAAPVEVGVFEEEALDVAIAGNYAYLVSNARLRVIDIHIPSAPAEVGSSSSGYETENVAVSGAFAYTARRHEFRVFDISDPSQPHLMGQTRTGVWDTLSEMVVFDSHVVLVGAGHRGVEVVDVTDASEPFRLVSLYTPWSGYGVARSGEFAVIAGGPEGALIIDLSSLGCMTEMASVDMPGDILDIAVSGAFAYVATDDGGFRVFDVSTPEAPEEVWYDDANAVNSVAAEGDRVYASAGWSGLLIFDMSDPSSPVQVGVYDPDDYVRQVEASGASVFVRVGDWVRVIDVSDPSSPLEVAVLDWPLYYGTMAYSDGYLFVLERYGDILRVNDVRTPSAPVEVSSVGVDGLTNALAAGGGYVFLTDHNGGLKVIDVNEPSAPHELCNSFSNRYGFSHYGGVTVTGDRVFASTAMGLFVADLDAPCTPTFLGSCETSYFPDVVSGRYGYAAPYHSRLVVLDMGGPFGPVKIGDVATYGDSDAAAVDGGLLFSAESNGLRIMELDSPSSPESIGFVEIPSLIDIEVSAGFAFVLNGADGSLRVVDVNDSRLPLEVASGGRFGSQIHDLEVSGDLALLTDTDSAVIFDISDPPSPAWVETFYISMEQAEVEDLELHGDHAYSVSTFEGLQIYDLSTPATPQFAGRHPSFGGATVRVIGNTAYVGQLWGLLALDLDDPLLPLPMSFFPTMTRVTSVAPAGTCVFAVDNASAWAIDVGDPFTPIEAGTHETAAVATDVAVLGRHLIVTEGWAGFEVFDISGCPGAVPQDPRQVGGRRAPNMP